MSIRDASAQATGGSAASFQVALPEPFTFRLEERERRIRRFERFRVASGLASKDADVQVSTLIYAMGDKADDILRSLALSEEDCTNYGTIKTKLDNHFVQRRNTTFERARFNRRRQEEGEPVDAFITVLYTLAEHCGYGDLHHEMVHERIVVGIRNSALSEKLQLDTDLILQSTPGRSREEAAAMGAWDAGYTCGCGGGGASSNQDQARLSRWLKEDKEQCPYLTQVELSLVWEKPSA